jgi:multiple sugar transport system permease protein
VRRVFVAIAVAFLVAFCLGPFLWSVITSIKPNREVFSIPPTYLPSEVSIENYTGVMEQRPFGRYILNSLIVAAGSTILALAAALPAAYALAKLRLPGAPAIERGLIFFALFPPAVLIVPLFSVVRSLGLMNSHAVLIVVHAALNLPLAIWMMAAFFRELPSDLEDAARVDGFSRIGFLLKIALPLAAPAAAATAILLFVFSWNEFVIALTLMIQEEKQTVPVGIAMISGVTTYDIPWGQISAAVVMTTLPVIAAVLLMQKWIIRGLTSGAVKG